MEKLSYVQPPPIWGHFWHIQVPSLANSFKSSMVIDFDMWQKWTATFKHKCHHCMRCQIKTECCGSSLTLWHHIKVKGYTSFKSFENWCIPKINKCWAAVQNASDCRFYSNAIWFQCLSELKWNELDFVVNKCYCYLIWSAHIKVCYYSSILFFCEWYHVKSFLFDTLHFPRDSSTLQ